MVESSSSGDNFHEISTQLVTALLSCENPYSQQISKEVANEVLKPLLEKHISKGIRIIYKIPEKWFS